MALNKIKNYISNALKRSRETVKRLEESLNRKESENESLRKENEKLGRSLYGPRLHAYICYLKYDLGMTYGKIQRMIDDQYNIFISTGQLSEMVKRASRKFQFAYEDIKTSLLNQGHLHADETSWRVDGNNAWLWSFANDDVSFYLIDESRGQKVVKKVLG